MEKISVVIPAYNAEKYLEQCVASVLRQDYENLEILIINDGSVDGTAQLIEELRQRDSRIKALHKRHNEGLGAARNSALELITSDYIVFLDSDDWIDPNHVSDLYDLMQRTGADVAVANFTQFIEDENRYNLHMTDADYHEKIFSPEEWFVYQYGHPHNLSSCFTVPWGKLYKRHLFENILYYTGPFGEDDRTTWKIYLAADKIAYMHRSSLIYRVNSGSMTQVANPSTVFSPEPVLERLSLLSMLGFDLSREKQAFEWRAGLGRKDALDNGDMAEYKELQFKLQMLEKYSRKEK